MLHPCLNAHCTILISVMHQMDICYLFCEVLKIFLLQTNLYIIFFTFWLKIRKKLCDPIVSNHFLMYIRGQSLTQSYHQSVSGLQSITGNVKHFSTKNPNTVVSA